MKKMKSILSYVIMAVMILGSSFTFDINVDATELKNMVTNGDFDNGDSADVSGWKIGMATEEDVVETSTLANYSFDVDTTGWICGTNTSAEVVKDETSNSNVMHVIKVSGLKARSLESLKLSVEAETKVEVSLKLKTDAGKTISVNLIEYAGDTKLKDNEFSYEGQVDGWGDASKQITCDSKTTSVSVKISASKNNKNDFYVDNVVLIQKKSVGETTWSDGILLKDGNYKLKLSNDNKAIYDGATFEEGKWYEYSYDVLTVSEDEKSFECGLLINNEEKTALSGKFKAKADTQIGFFTKGTGEAYFDNLVVTEHEHNYTQNVQDDKTHYKDATCTEPAQYYEYCSDCGECNKDVIYSNGNALGHNISSKQPEVPATCTTDGTKEYWPCNRCNKKFTTQDATTEVEDLKINKHTQTFVEKVPATCTTDGTEAHYKCQCEQLYKDEECKQSVTLNELKISKSNHSNKVYFKAKEATCTEDGNTEYWSCPDCNELFGDEACENSIDKKDTVLEAIGHKASHIERVEANCTEDGNIEYWYCANCDNYFTDEACTDETTKEDTILPALGHKTTYVAGKAATCTKDGYKEYYTCSTCKKIFTDSKGTTETKISPLKKHTVKDVKEVKATYTKKGMKAHYKCSCGKLYTDKACTKATTKAKLTIPVKKLTVAKTSVKKVTAKSKALAITWTKKSGVTGYEVQVALKKNFKSGLKKTTVKGASKTSVTVKKLKAKKTYYVRIRAYKKVEGKTFYSAWSSVKSKKTK